MLNCKLAVLKALIIWGFLLSQHLFVSPSAGQLSEDARMSQITLYPGDPIYSLWGHSALRVYDPQLGIDIAYNYGTFEFGNPVVFAARFAYGKLDYALSRQSYPAVVSQAQRQRRSIIEQQLHLDHDQKQRLFEYLENNMLPENRTYRYDFLYDNCATRIRDLFTEVLGFELPSSAHSNDTYRQQLYPYSTRRSVLNLGINLGMGLPVDQQVSDRSYLPLGLMEVLGSMEVDSAMLVSRTDTLFTSPPLPRQPLPWSLIISWLWLAAGIVITFKFKRFERLFDRAHFTMTGLAGVLVAFLWFISLHSVTQPNFNLLWLWPTHLFLAINRKPYSWLRFYHGAAFMVCSLFVVAHLLLPQSFPHETIPLALAGALRSGHLAWKDVPRTGFEPVLPA